MWAPLFLYAWGCDVKSVVRVSEYMTSTPITIGIDAPLTLAVSLMQQHNIRHLPVTRRGRMVGVVSERDVKAAIGLKGIDTHTLTVRWVYSPVPYHVLPSTPLSKVVRHMRRQKLGSALVVRRGELLGIFTVTDALDALDDLLSSRR